MATLWAAGLAILLSGCSKPPPESPPPESRDASTPGGDTAIELDESMDMSTAEAVDYKSTAGGIPTTYRAYFVEGALLGIAETRMPPAGGSQRGDYLFHGARLTRYTGAALDSAAQVEIELDSSGRLISAQRKLDGAGGEAREEEITAIRNRAQLLRSHALAQRATRDHAGH